jgi:hypothetical protein
MPQAVMIFNLLHVSYSRPEYMRKSSEVLLRAEIMEEEGEEGGRVVKGAPKAVNYSELGRKHHAHATRG